MDLKKSPWRALDSKKYMYIHVSCDPGFYFTVFLFFLQVSMPGILHEALPILLYPMNKMHKRLVKFMCKSILGNIKSSL